MLKADLQAAARGGRLEAFYMTPFTVVVVAISLLLYLHIPIGYGPASLAHLPMLRRRLQPGARAARAAGPAYVLGCQAGSEIADSEEAIRELRAWSASEEPDLKVR